MEINWWSSASVSANAGLNCEYTDAASSSLYTQRESKEWGHTSLDHTFHNSVCSWTSLNVLLVFYIASYPCRTAAVGHCHFTWKTSPTDVLTKTFILLFVPQLHCLFLHFEIYPSSPCCVSMTEWSVVAYSSMKRCSSSFQLSTRYALLPHTC